MLSLPTGSQSQQQLRRVSTCADAGPYALNLSGQRRDMTDRVSISDRLRISSKPMSQSPQQERSAGMQEQQHKLENRTRLKKKSGRQLWVERRRRSLMPHAVRRRQRSLPDLESSSPTGRYALWSPSSLEMPPLGVQRPDSGLYQGHYSTHVSRSTGPKAAAAQNITMKRTSSVDLANVVTKYPATCILHVRGIGTASSGQYLQEAALISLFSNYGACLAAQVRVRANESTGEDTSWALVAMDSELAVEKAVHAKVMAGDSELEVTRYSQKIAAASQGSMGRVAAKVDKSYFAKAARVADARILLAQGQKLLLQGQKMHMLDLADEGREGRGRGDHQGSEQSPQEGSSTESRKMQLWIRAAEKFETALDLDPSGRARLACRQAKRLIEEERQTQKRLARFKLFRQKYGEDWQAAMNMEQDPATVTREQMREIFDMVDTDRGGTLDRDEVETLINFFNSGVDVTEQEVNDAMAAMVRSRKDHLIVHSICRE